MTKTEIFDDIVSVVKTDASFCKDKSGGDVKKGECKWIVICLGLQSF